jgi:hypothetical protein
MRSRLSSHCPAFYESNIESQKSGGEQSNESLRQNPNFQQLVAELKHPLTRHAYGCCDAAQEAGVRFGIRRTGRLASLGRIVEK